MGEPMTDAERAHRANAVRVLRYQFGPAVTRQMARAAYKRAKKAAVRDAKNAARFIRRASA